MALARDRNGHLWVGTEDFGVWQLDAANISRPTQHTAQAARWQIDAPYPQTDANGEIEGLGDSNAYALAIDGKGRVWAAQRTHGVAVWNGETWRNYGAESGPLGERVYDIAVCPRDGAVWIASSGGLSRYSVQKDTWRYFTRSEGLPSDQIQTLAFDKAGNIVVGTQNDGLALAKAADNYTKWRVVQSVGNGLEPVGKGLPSNQINDLLVARDSTIYVATTRGLAWSRDKGATWNFVRGADYADKVRRSAIGSPFKSWKDRGGAWLLEDYVTCLAQDARGLLWIGHRQQPYEVIDFKNQTRVWSSEQDFVTPKVATSSTRSTNTPPQNALAPPDNYVTQILPVTNGATLIARYGGGLTVSAKPFAVVKTVKKAIPATSSTRSIAKTLAKPVANAFPSVYTPTETELAAMLKRVRSFTTVKKAIDNAAHATFLGDDWTTIGDWVGRYGRQKAVLWAMNAPYSQFHGTDYYGYPVHARIGPHHAAGDAVRHWIHWAKTDNPNVLYSPSEGGRSEAELDDHAEEYPMSYEGPDLWKYVEVPKGAQRLSLYFFNKDGHDGANRYRDYIVEIRECKSDPVKLSKDRYWSPMWAFPNGATPKQIQALVNSKTEAYSEYQIKLAMKQPVLASARVRDFWGGVYKSFMLRGGHKYWVRIAKNDSFNTISNGIFLDRLKLPVRNRDGDWDDADNVDMGRYYPPESDIWVQHLIEKRADGRPMRGLKYTNWEQMKLNDKTTPLRLRLALQLWQALDDARESPQVGTVQRRYRLMAYRTLLRMQEDVPTTWDSGGAPKMYFSLGATLQNWRWHLGLWSEKASDDRKAFRDAMADAYGKHLAVNQPLWDLQDKIKREEEAAKKAVTSAKGEQ